MPGSDVTSEPIINTPSDINDTDIIVPEINDTAVPTINTMVTDLSQSLVVLQLQAFTNTYLENNVQKTITIDGTTVPISMIVPSRSLYIDQINIEYTTTTPFTLVTDNSMKITVQYKSVPTEVL
jgi:hypothetical protein